MEDHDWVAVALCVAAVCTAVALVLLVVYLTSG